MKISLKINDILYEPLVSPGVSLFERPARARIFRRKTWLRDG